MPAPSRPETCVGAVVVEQGHLLLIQRGRGAAVGQWSVPGGRVEWGETLAQAVEREVAEETGLAVVCDTFIGWVELMGPDHHYVILDFRARLAPSGPSSPPARRGSGRPARALPPLVAGDDAADAAWVPLGELGSVALVDGLYRFLADHGVLGQD